MDAISNEQGIRSHDFTGRMPVLRKAIAADLRSEPHQSWQGGWGVGLKVAA